jgi:uncharacterized protein YdiU (UPF0061 family)
MTQFSKIKINSHFSEELPADKSIINHPRQVNNSCFSYVETKQPLNPKMVHYSNSFTNDLGIEVNNSEKDLELLSGAIKFPDFSPYAMCYGGHQFGHWAGQLGDGRAINIAEADLQGTNWKFQLKGSGRTPYSRGADGLAVLRSSVREYLCSEAMHNLGVPSTRALSLVKTGDLVPRDILYDGNVKNEPGAVVCRVSPSFIRFGSFQIFSARNETDTLKELVDYTIKHHFSHLGNPSKETYLAFFKEVVAKTREMIIHWQRVGFVHGVMNTDNMSILGLTIDYGPYGWLENFDPGWTPNTTDIQNKRYRFGDQHEIALWNLMQLANALYPLINQVEPLEEILEEYKVSYLNDYYKMMTSKLGLYTINDVTDKFISQLLVNMENSEIDMTLFYRELSNNSYPDFISFWTTMQSVSYLEGEKLDMHKEEWMNWFSLFAEKIENEGVAENERSTRMKAVNPKYVLRNYMAQLAIDDAEKGDYSLIDELYKLLLKPYDEQPEMDKWFAKRPDWAKEKVGCSMLSCSS